MRHLPHRRQVTIAAALLAAGMLAACGTDKPPVTVAEPGGESGGESTQPAAAESQPAVPVTRNTSRIAGADPTADAAEVALATHPRSGGAKPIEAAVVINADDWQAGIAAAQLAGPPLNLPILLSEPGAVPDATADALAVLDPKGGSGPNDAAAYSIDGAALPDGLAGTEVDGEGAAGIAAEIDKLHGRLTGAAPASVLVVSEDEPAFSMPAAAWAARSGDPVLFADRDSAPEATLTALRSHPDASVYVLGPESAISERALRELRRATPDVRRISAPDPVANAVEFARFAEVPFGWGVTDPGHGLVVARSDRPADAGAAASLSASGTFGPLLLTDSATTLPTALRDFLLAIKPGYRDDPTRALYNHVWLIGDASAISGPLQGEIDDLAELTADRRRHR